jgi:hypothetical protein
MRITTDRSLRGTTASRWRRATAAATVALACAGVAHAAAPKAPPVDPCATPTDSNYLVADATKTGTIDLIFYNAKGARVVFFECVGDRLVRLGAKRAATAADPTTFADAATWSCDRLARRFAAVAVLPDGSIAFGSYSVRTTSCASRFELRAPRRVKPGAKASVRVVDRWGIGGIHPELCIGPADARLRCKALAFPRAVTLASRRFKATERGSWRVELRVRRERIRAAIAVGGDGPTNRKQPPIVLAAGDSTMQGIDSFLADELADSAYVRSDVHPGSGITRGVYWEWHAKSQTKRLRQRVTVMSVGAASDGLPIPNAIGVLRPCCGELWIQEYANRTRAIMQTFLRGGRARVVWLTPPEPRWGPRAEITHATNIAVERAASGLRGVKIIRIDLMFAPNGYTDVVTYRGRQVRVRESDGVHLNVAGTAIAARAVAAAIREGADDGL